jgi:uncharacterized protein (DUF58 family)
MSAVADGAFADELLDEQTLRELERLSLPAIRSVTANIAGERPGPATGARADFADYRRYVAGDDLRRVDWNVYARLRQLVVKVGREEGRLAVHILLDTSRSMLLGDPQKLRHAQRLTALFGAVALLGGDTAHIVALSDGRATPLALLDGARRLSALLEAIAAVPLGRKTGLAAAVEDYRRTSTHADLVLLISDANVPADDLDAAMRGASVSELALLHVVAADELRPRLRGAVTLRDTETAEELEVELDDETLARYELLQQRFVAGVEATARQHGGGYIRAVTDVPPLEVLFDAVGAPAAMSR